MINKIEKMFLIIKNILQTWYSYCVKCYHFGMLTRKAVFRVVSVKEAVKSCDSFLNDVLPTKKDVLQRLLQERNWRTSAAAVIVANELHECLIYCNLYCISVDGIVFRILTLLKDFRQIESQPKKGIKDPTSVRQLIII